MTVASKTNLFFEELENIYFERETLDESTFD